jgi:hypothetical protein
MIPMRTSTVFKSRWMALLWAAGIVWGALDYAGSDHNSAAGAAPVKAAAPSEQTGLTDASGRPITAEDLRKLSGGADSN